MTTLLMNILFALIWTVITGSFEPENFLAGFVLVYFILWLVDTGMGQETSYFLKVRQTAGFLVFFSKELIKANLRVAYDVVTPCHHMKPGVVAVPLDVETDMEIMLLANLITLTPGTLSLDISSDRKVLYVHAMYDMDDIQSVRRNIKEGFERRVMELLR